MARLIKEVKRSYYMRQINRCYVKAMDGGTNYSTLYWIEKRNDYLNKMLSL